MNLRKQKQLASRALGVSIKRVKFNLTNDSKKDLKELISREGVKDLVEEKIITKLPKKGNSRTAANYILSQKKKGRRSGQGTRSGTANARFKKKDQWIIKIRSLRALLRNMKELGKIESKVFRELYKKSKGNFFRNKRHMVLFIEQNNLIKDDSEDTRNQKISGHSDKSERNKK